MCDRGQAADQTIEEMLDRIPDALARVQEGLAQASRGEGVPLDALTAPPARPVESWHDELGPLLSATQVSELLGDILGQRVDELLRGRRLIGLLDSSGRWHFPGFQFHEGRPLTPLIDAYWSLVDGTLDEWTAAAWLVAADDALDGSSAVAWARDGRDPARLALIARRDAARLAQ